MEEMDGHHVGEGHRATGCSSCSQGQGCYLRGPREDTRRVRHLGRTNALLGTGGDVLFL